MKPVKQTILGSKGNCFIACIASIFECSIDDIPELNAHLDGGMWIKVLAEWLAPRGLQYTEVTIKPALFGENFKYKDFYYIAIGPTKRSRNILHAVVCRKGEMVFDPHPDNDGIIIGDELQFGIFIKTFI